MLSEKEFAILSRLRECRKTIAANDAVPAYAVFTDKELVDTFNNGLYIAQIDTREQVLERKFPLAILNLDFV